MAKSKRGGARAGAGAKPKGPMRRKMLSTRLPTDLIDRLKESGESQSDQIERALRNYYNWNN